MATATQGKTAATELIEKMRNPQLPEEELRRTMKTFLVQYANRIFVRLPEKKQKAAALMAYSAIDANPAILRCEPSSIIKSVAEAALYDLTIGGVQAHCYLIPYGRDAKLQIGYKGLIELCRRAGEVKDIMVEDVRVGDKFDVTFGDDPRIEHKPACDADRSGRPVTHVYAVVRLRDGGVVRRVFSAGEIDQNKEKYSQGWQRAEAYRQECLAKKQPINEKRLSPWHTAWLPMAKKTVLRAMVNGGLIPIATEVREVLGRDDDEPETIIGTASPAVEPPRLSDILPSAPLEEVESRSLDEVVNVKAILAEPEPPVSTNHSFQAYADAMELTDMETDARAVYDAHFGPASKVAWTPEQDSIAINIRDSHIKAIKAKRGPKTKA